MKKNINLMNDSFKELSDDEIREITKNKIEGIQIKGLLEMIIRLKTAINRLNKSTTVLNCIMIFLTIIIVTISIVSFIK